jgi:sugar fermentation stimulation protein A
MKKYEFNSQLIEGLIKSRPNRFIMMVKLNNRIEKCHCPSTGRIGNIIFKDIPCLVSKSENKKRKTSYTVEAISISPLNKNKDWIGINQTKANSYIEFFLKNNQLDKICSNVDKIEREVKIGNSRIDFHVDNTYIEVKTPLISLPSGKNIELKENSRFNSFERLIKHFGELGNKLEDGSRSILLMCYLYDAKPFKAPPTDKYNEKIKIAAENAMKRGVENWQINMKIDGSGIRMIRYFKLKVL